MATAPHGSLWSAVGCTALLSPTMGATSHPLFPTTAQGPHALALLWGTGTCTGQVHGQCMASFTVGQTPHPCSPPLPQAGDAGAGAMHWGDLWEDFSADQWTHSEEGKKKGAEEKPASGRRRGLWGPAAKANKEAT